MYDTQDFYYQAKDLTDTIIEYFTLIGLNIHTNNYTTASTYSNEHPYISNVTTILGYIESENISYYAYIKHLIYDAKSTGSINESRIRVEFTYDYEPDKFVWIIKRYNSASLYGKQLSQAILKQIKKAIFEINVRQAFECNSKTMICVK
jgi:hypothetical protein